MDRGAWRAGYRPQGLKESDSLAKFIDFLDLIKELPLCFINALFFIFNFIDFRSYFLPFAYFSPILVYFL